MDWFRFYTGTLNSAKVQELPDKLFKAWVNFMCVARLFDGVLPGHTEIAFRCRITPECALKWTHELKKRGLIDEVCDQNLASVLRKNGRKDIVGDHFFVMHDWDEWQKSSDDSAPRKRKQRVCLQMSRDMSQDGHALEQNRTEQIQNRTEQTQSADAREFAAAFPDQSDQNSTVREYLSLVDPSEKEAVFACLERYKRSAVVARGVVQSGWKWLRAQKENGWRGEWERAPPKKRTEEEELQQMDRIIAEVEEENLRVYGNREGRH